MYLSADKEKNTADFPRGSWDTYSLRFLKGIMLVLLCADAEERKRLQQVKQAPGIGW